MAIRIKRAAKHRKLLELLTEENGPFEHFYEVLSFCAPLGFARDRREPIGKADEPIRWEQFTANNPQADLLVLLLASGSTDDSEILSNENEAERFQIFEEYANGGLYELTSEIERHPAKPVREVVLDLVLDQERTDSADLDLGGIVEGLVSD